MAKLKENAGAAILKMIRFADRQILEPTEIVVWNYTAFILEACDQAYDSDPLPSTIYGRPIKVDPTISEGTVELRDARGHVVGIVINIGGGRG